MLMFPLQCVDLCKDLQKYLLEMFYLNVIANIETTNDMFHSICSTILRNDHLKFLE